MGTIHERHDAKTLQPGDFGFKDEHGKDYPDWQEKRLRDVCHINPKSTELPDEFVYIDLESVVKGSLIKSNHILKVGAPSRAQRLLAIRDVLFQMVRPIPKKTIIILISMGTM